MIRSRHAVKVVRHNDISRCRRKKAERGLCIEPFCRNRRRKDRRRCHTCENRFRQALLGSELGGQPPQTIKFNHKYLRDTLNAIEGESVRIECPQRDSWMVAVREGSFLGIVWLLAPPAE